MPNVKVSALEDTEEAQEASPNGATESDPGDKPNDNTSTLDKSETHSDSSSGPKDESKGNSNKNNSQKHIIHGSFRKLDYANAQKAGDIEARGAIKNRMDELKVQKPIMSENDFNNLDNITVVIVTDGIPINQVSFGRLQSLRMIIIGNECESDSLRLTFANMPNLERVEVGSNCFLSVTVLHVNNCPKLRRLFIGSGSFARIENCVIENNPLLLELQLGGSATDSLQEENKTELSIVTSNPPEVVHEVNTAPRVLKLASCRYLSTLMNRLAPSEEISVWKWILPRL